MLDDAEVDKVPFVRTSTYSCDKPVEASVYIICKAVKKTE